MKDKLILKSIIKCYQDFIDNKDIQTTGLKILDEAIKLTSSEYGFIVEIRKINDTKLSSRLWAVSGTNSEKIKILPCKGHSIMDFSNPNNLLGVITTTKEILISNDPKNDSRGNKCKKQPADHFDLKNFMGIPLILQDELIGVLGLANRNGGYNSEIVKYLQPFIVACTSIIYGFNQKQLEIEKSLLKTEQTLQVERRLADTQNNFLAIMSHEIITPLNGILGITEILGDTTLSSSQIEYVKIINSCSKHLHYLIGNILDYSKLKINKLNLEPISFNLKKCMEENHDVIIVQANNKKLNVNFTISPDIPDFIIGDPKRLGQILRNLLLNAIKFTDKGSIFTRVSVNSCSDSEYDLLFSVSDTGIGIPEDKLGIIFENFTQLNKSYIRTESGTGLGLAISKRLVELMNGHIWVESKKGYGSTFNFIIKVEKDQQNVNQIQKTIINKCKHYNILIIDDMEINRKILFKYLLEWKIKPTMCGSGDEALLLLESGYIFDILLIDICMPGMSGITLAKRVCNLQPKCILVAISSLTELTQAESQYFDYKLFKPIKKMMLYEVFKTINDNYLKTQKNLTSHNKNITEINNSLSDTLCESSFESDSQDDNSSNSSSNNSELLDIQIHSQNILIVEDNTFNQIVAEKLLNKIGYVNIDIAENGKKALKMIKKNKNKYNVIFLDIIMPVMDGYSVAKVIKTKYHHLLDKIIVLSAVTNKKDRNKFAKLGINNYITKPINQDLLKDLLQKII